MKNKQLVSICLALLLVSSLASIAGTYSTETDLTFEQDIFKNPLGVQNYLAKESITHEIKLSDTASGNEKPISSEENLVREDQTSRNVKVHLSDTAVASSKSPLENKILLIKQNSDRKAIMEKIFYADRIRLHERSLSGTNLQFLNSQDVVEDYTFLDNLVEDQLVLIDDKAAQKAAPEKLQYLKARELSNGLVLEFKNDLTLNQLFNEKNVFNEFRSIASVENPVSLLLIVPVAGFILFNPEKQRLQFYNYRRVFCFALIIILLSWTVATPLSISSAYWGIAAAEKPSNVNSDLTPESRVRKRGHSHSWIHARRPGSAHIISALSPGLRVRVGPRCGAAGERVDAHESEPHGCGGSGYVGLPPEPDATRRVVGLRQRGAELL